MIFEKLMYSKKFIVLMFFILYFSILYIIVNYSYEGLIYGTVVVVAILLFFLIYAHRHVSKREVYGLLFFISLTIVIGALSGVFISGFDNPGILMYSIVLTLSIILLLLIFSKLYRL